MWEEEQKEEDGFPQAVVHATTHVNCIHKETHMKPEASPEPLSAASKSHCISPHRVYMRAIQAVNFPPQPAAFGSWLLHMCVYICVVLETQETKEERDGGRESDISTVRAAGSRIIPWAFCSCSTILTNVSTRLRKAGMYSHV